MNRIALCFLTLLVSSTFAFGQQYKVLYNFGSAPNDGTQPVSNPVMDKAGNLYGVTYYGGDLDACDDGCGTVWQLSPGENGWSETILYTFCLGQNEFNCPGGATPNGLTIDSAGNLYGTTQSAGTTAQGGHGVAFELSPPPAPGGAWTYTLLHTFCSVYNNNNCVDGDGPWGGITADAVGNLYGTTITGGPNGSGEVFELSPSPNGWQETVIYSFCSQPNCDDGYRPTAGVALDKSGNLYGTTSASRPDRGNCTVICGELFKLSPGASGWTLTVLMEFPVVKSLPPESAGPGPASVGVAGNVYATVLLGGNYNNAPMGSGGVVQVTPGGKTYSFLFDTSDGSNPNDGVLVDTTRGFLFGTMGYLTAGSVFQIDQSGKETLLYTFCQQPNCLDGYDPDGLYEDSAGNLFGVTNIGGSIGPYGEGVVFEIVRQ